MIIQVTDADLRRYAQYGASAGESISSAVKKNREDSEFGKDNTVLLQICERDYNNLDKLRRLRRRNIRYSNGDQWSDVVKGEDGKPIREDVKLSREGKTPLKHNFIKQTERNIQGQMLSNRVMATVVARTEDDSELGEMLTNTLQACLDNNEEEAMNISAMNDLLYGGITCAKIRYGYVSEKDKADGILDHVSMDRLFFNTELEDPRMRVRRIGEIHDYTMGELLCNFAQSPDDEKVLRELYPDYSGELETVETANKVEPQDINSFTNVNSPYKCRVFEIWQQKERWVRRVHDYADGTETIITDTKIDIDAINEMRIQQGLRLGIPRENIPLLDYENIMEHYWEARFLTPRGICIKCMESPYKHQSHPYVIKTMPMIDGTVRAALTDLVDLNRYINRLIVMLDFIMGNSAKGVLMVPEPLLEGHSVDEFAKEYVKANGIIVYKPNPKYPGLKPEQLSANSTNIGAFQMLELEMRLFQQISGLNGAIQGYDAKSGTPSSLYAQEAQNSATNMRVIFDVFSSFLKRRDTKLLKVLMQYYTEKRFVDISGSAYNETAKYYSPELAEKVTDLNLVVANATNTPVYRQIADDTLQQLLGAGVINLKTYLKNCSLPFAKKLLADITQAEEQGEAGMTADQYAGMLQQAMSPEVRGQMSPEEQRASQYMQQAMAR